ncbi:pfkB-like carbohydrate kinase family protein [Euphorbia peplus]|nr:pfkB-like carbohydrate kinase family protein [Euphorbia peplus]
MEDAALRRLDCLSRHFFLPVELNSNLYQGLVKGGQGNNEVADPVVIGGMVLDIHATPSVPTNPRTTSPGKVKYELGGVARNIAECMSKLGTNPYMISSLGTDMAGNLLLEHWNAFGLSTEGIQKHEGIRTPVITNVFDTHGEVLAGVADVEAVEKFLTPQWILQFERNISSSSVLLVDANLSLHALEASCQVARKYNIPVWFEPVSVAKSARIASVVNDVTFVSPNEDELIAMTNALSGANIFHPIKSKVVRLTGAGDCLVGGTLASLCSGLDLMQSVAVGISVAKSAVEAETNVPSAFSLASITEDARLVYSSAKLLVNHELL